MTYGYTCMKCGAIVSQYDMLTHWHQRCRVSGDVYSCSLPADHDGGHRAHVSDDLTRAYVAIDEEGQPR